MARPRNFDVEEVVEKAMQVFWTHGYEDAAMPELLAGMGLTRGSLYKAFGDKKSLFLKALDRYEGEFLDKGVEMLTDPAVPDGRDRITTMFQAVCKGVADGNRRGCLLCTAAAGPSAYDPDIATAVNRGLSKLQAGLVGALEASPRHAGWSDERRVRLGDHLLHSYVGLRILSRSQAPIARIEEAALAIDDLLAG